MAITDSYTVVLLLLVFSTLFFRKMTNNRSRTSVLPTRWPIFGMLPALLMNVHRAHEFVTNILKETGGTFVFKGPWFMNVDYLFTADQANIQYVLSKNFSNYPKGPEMRKIFDIFGDSFVSTDFEFWEIQRKTTRILMNHPKFLDTLEGITWGKVENGLVPFLENACKSSTTVDLKDMFQRLIFDCLSTLLLEYDPMSLSTHLPKIKFEKAAKDTEEALFFRHVLPEVCWKLQRTLGIGTEKNLSEASKSFDDYIYRCISLKKNSNHDSQSFSMLASLMEAYKEVKGSDNNPNKFLRDTLLNLMIAGKSGTGMTLAWFFWLLSKNPLVKTKILEEMNEKLNLPEKKNQAFRLNAEELQKLVYLHGAISETLRLYPPVSIEHKAPLKADTLPSGHKIGRNKKILLFFYSVGRMETTWGNDCLEFKPERWITETGNVKHVPFYKFPAFLGGPRTCLGTNMAFMELKSVAATIVYNYNVEVVEGDIPTPGYSIMLEMKQGLNARITKRNVLD